MRSAPARNRPLYAALVVITILFGLATRRFGAALPSIVADYGGDTLWTTMVFFALAVIFRRQSTRMLWTGAFAISVFVECSQLYHAPWLDAIRATRLGALALGQGFLWSDLVCYAAGAVLGAAVDYLMLQAGDVTTRFRA